MFQLSVFKDVKKSIAIKIKCFTEFESREVAIDLVKDIRVNLVAKILLQVKQLLENSTTNGRKVYGAGLLLTTIQKDFMVPTMNFL